MSEKQLTTLERVGLIFLLLIAIAVLVEVSVVLHRQNHIDPSEVQLALQKFERSQRIDAKFANQRHIRSLEALIQNITSL